MDGLLIAVVGAIGAIGGVAIDRLITAWLGRRKARADTRQTTADAEKIEQETEHSATAYWREQVKELTSEMRSIKDDFKEFKIGTEMERETYQRQAGALLNKLDAMALEQERTNAQLLTANTKMDAMAREQQQTNTQLTDANTRLEAANNTIQALREEVKQLREQIIELLVKQAENKGD